MALWESPYASGVKDLLDYLDWDILKSLAITATANRILPENREEATELILRYTDNLARLFSYKRMTSEVLINYLHKKKVPVRIRMTKAELVETVRGELEKSAKGNKPTESKSTKREFIEEYKPVMDKSNQENEPFMNKSTLNQSMTKEFIMADSTTEDRVTTFRSPDTPESEQYLPASPSVNFSLSTATNSAALNFSVNAAEGSISLDVQQRDSGVVSSEGPSEVFVREFCKWFYTMVNRLQPEACHLQGDTLTVDVFVANSSVDMYLYAGQQVIEKHAVGQQDAFTTLRNTLLECGVCFAPTIDGRTQCEMSSFGMAKLQLCGTLHRREALVGVFEQEFGLVKCPDGSWKVMILKVNLRQTPFSSSMPIQA